MVQFVNLRELKTKAGQVLRRLNHGDLVLTVRGKPKVLLHKISERDLSLNEEFTSSELDKLERLSNKPGSKTVSSADAPLKDLKKHR